MEQNFFPSPALFRVYNMACSWHCSLFNAIDGVQIDSESFNNLSLDSDQGSVLLV